VIAYTLQSADVMRGGISLHQTESQPADHTFSCLGCKQVPQPGNQSVVKQAVRRPLLGRRVVGCFSLLTELMVCYSISLFRYILSH
jgi:hypothetical protein